MIQDHHKTNFETLKRAFKNGDVALRECTDTLTGKPIVVICAINVVKAEYEYIPAAKMFDNNPFEELTLPT